MSGSVVTTRTIDTPSPEGRDFRHPVRYEVYYDRHDDKFWVELPAYLLGDDGDDKGKTKVSDTSPQKVLDQVEEICRSFVGMIKESRKVILFSFHYRYQDGEGEGLDRDEGTGLTLEFRVGWEFRMKDGKRYAKDPNPYKKNNWINIEKGYSEEPMKVLAWTQEREDFFTDFQGRIEQLVKRMKPVLMSTRRTAKLADGGLAGQRLLLPAPEKKE
jgi:hypothetical protein